MLLAILLWSTTPTAAPIVDELTLPEWPAGMRAEQRNDGVWLNQVAADAFHLRLRFCDALPDLAREIGTVRVTEALAIQDELHQVDVAYRAVEAEQLRREHWSPLQRVGAVLGGAVVGAAVGFLAASLVAR